MRVTFLTILLLSVVASQAADDYKLGPDSMAQEGCAAREGDEVFVDEQNFSRNSAGLLGVCAGTV
jgi:hypothetical protein